MPSPRPPSLYKGNGLAPAAPMSARLCALLKQFHVVGQAAPLFLSPPRAPPFCFSPCALTATAPQGFREAFGRIMSNFISRGGQDKKGSGPLLRRAQKKETFFCWPLPCRGEAAETEKRSTPRMNLAPQSLGGLRQAGWCVSCAHVARWHETYPRRKNRNIRDIFSSASKNMPDGREKRAQKHGKRPEPSRDEE